MQKFALVSGFSILLIAGLIAVAGFGQSSPQDSKKRSEHSADSQWEYLIVAGGNVNLSTAGNEQYGSMRKQPDGSFAKEAFALERNLDKLGAKGWELITVSGTPTDPVYYLKRPREAH
jgi:hypothetical protein